MQTRLSGLILFAMILTAGISVEASEMGEASLRLGQVEITGGGAGEVTELSGDARLKAELEAAARVGGGGGVRPVADVRRRLQVVKAKSRPVIDGKLDEEAWKDAVVLGDFLVSQNFNVTGPAETAENRTEARVLYDEEGMYVGVRAWQDPETIYSTVKANGWLRPDLDWQTGGEPWANTGCDEIEVVVDTELTQTSYQLFQVNPDGVMQKRYMPAARVSDGFYKRIDPVLVENDGWEAKTSRDEEGWSAEIFIPWKSVGMRKILPVGDRDVFFDMVQERSVMGFNVNRISHRKREASSWSVSRGAMFFRDAENFGQAYFRTLPCWIAAVEFGEGADGTTKASVTVRSRSDAAEEVTLVTREWCGDAEATAESEATVPAGGEATVEAALLGKTPGLHTVEARLSRKSDGWLMDRAKYVYSVPEPVSVVLPKSVLYEGEKDFYARVETPGSGGVERLSFTLVGGGKTVAAVETGELKGESFTAPFALEGIGAGEYELVVEAFAGGASSGEARGAFRVMESPFAAKVGGKAGEGADGGPVGFAAVAEGYRGEDKPRAGETEPEWVSATVREAGVILYGVSSATDFQSNRTPREAEAQTAIGAFAAGGEYEPVCFVVRAMKDLEGLAVTASEARSAAGDVLGARVMDLRGERSDGMIVKQEHLAALPAGAGRRYFLTVWVGEGTAAGRYEGVITAEVEGGVKVEREYRFVVLPFALAAAPLANSIYGRNFGSRDVERDMVQAVDLLSHGMDNVTCARVFFSERIGAVVHHMIWDLEKKSGEGWLGEGQERFPLKLDDKTYENMKVSGQRAPFVIDVNYVLRYLPCTEENLELFEKAIRRIEAKREEHGLGEFMYHLVDEPNNHYTYDDGRYGRRYGLQKVDFFGEALRRIGVRQYSTMNSAGKGYDVGEKFMDDIDVWCTNFISNQAQVERWTTGGKELWLYNFGGDGSCKGAMRSTYGFYALKVKAAGVTKWVHSHFAKWNNQERKYANSSAWESAREGIDDTRYAATLEILIAKAKTRGGKAAVSAVEAEADLEGVVGAYGMTNWEKVAFEKRHDASDWDRWRWIVAQWIVRLAEEV